MDAVRRRWLDRIIMSNDGSNPTTIRKIRPTLDRVLGCGEP